MTIKKVCVGCLIRWSCITPIRFLCAGWGGWYGSGPPPGGGQISASASDSSLGSTTSYTSAASKEVGEKLLGELQAFHINIKAAVVEWSMSFCD